MPASSDAEPAPEPAPEPTPEPTPEPEPEGAPLPPGPLLAIDPGSKRVGVAAVGALGIVTPVTTLQAVPEADWLRELRALAEARDAVGVVVGLPVNMDGTEGPAARGARELARRVAQATGLPVALQDERLTSLDAASRFRGSGMTRDQRKKRLDAVAAAAILETYVSRHPRL